MTSGGSRSDCYGVWVKVKLQLPDGFSGSCQGRRKNAKKKIILWHANFAILFGYSLFRIHKIMTWHCIDIEHKFVTSKSFQYYYYLLQLSCHSVAAIRTLVTNKNKHTSRKQYKNTVQRIQNTVNTSTHITKTPTHTHTHTLQNPHTQTTTNYKTHT